MRDAEVVGTGPLIVAHRGFSGRQPEQTVAAYREAIAWSESTGTPLLLECDVQLSADGALICLHDRTLDRTSDGTGSASDRTLAELRRLDFGRWHTADPTAEQRALITLPELLELVRDARSRAVPVELAVEAKHPIARDVELEQRLAELLHAVGWAAAGAPVRLLSFDPAALQRMAALLPELERTLLIERTLGRWADGRLPSGAVAAGVDLRLLRADPDYAARVRAHGGTINAWTANTAEEIEFCLALDVEYLTTDRPDRVLDAIMR